MTNPYQNPDAIAISDASRCKCSKSESRLNGRAKPYFEDVTTRMRERHCDLIGRQKHLKDKITTLERSIPALMAYNMWTAGQTCAEPPYCKVREIMKKFSTYPDPTEKLLNDLRRTVKSLNGETADLHEKIIDADMKLEEASMELESLELANQEMEDAENNLKKEIRSYETPSLDSIHSDDLTCLTKIRQLAKEELSLKDCIDHLETKEAIFKEQIDRLLMSKDFRSKRTAMQRGHESECNKGRVHCVFQKQKENIECRQRKIKAKNKEIIRGNATNADNGIDKQTVNKVNGKKDQTKSAETAEKKSSWISSWWRKSGPDGLSDSQQEKKVPPTIEKDVDIKPCVAQTPTTVRCKEEAILPCDCVSSNYKKMLHSLPATSYVYKCPILSATKMAPCCASLNTNLRTKSSGKSCSCDRALMDLEPSGLKNPCTRNLPCPPPPCLNLDTAHGRRAECVSELSNRGTIPDSRQSAAPCKEWTPPCRITGCRCNCKGRCIRGPSDVPCECGVAPLRSSGKDYRTTAADKLNSVSWQEGSNSEEEFCDCCSCGCEDSDVTVSCQCN